MCLPVFGFQTKANVCRIQQDKLQVVEVCFLFFLIASSSKKGLELKCFSWINLY